MSALPQPFVQRHVPMDLREVIRVIVSRGVVLNTPKSEPLLGPNREPVRATVTTIQLRENARIFVRIPSGYIPVEIQDMPPVSRKALEAFFSFLAPDSDPEKGAEPDQRAESKAAPAASRKSWHARLAESAKQAFDCAATLDEHHRIRASLFFHGEPNWKGEYELGATIRVLPHPVPTCEFLGVGAFMKDWMKSPGLILVTGPTGMGKSTTMAALLSWVNNDAAMGTKHIGTLENPIEYELSSKYSIITQRQIGSGGVQSFADGIEAFLRQQADIIMVGEILTRDAAYAALRAAQLGHTVLASGHGDGPVGALQAFLGLFERGEADDRARELARALIGVTYQRLVPSKDESRPRLASAMLMNSRDVQTHIAARTWDQLDAAMQNAPSRTMWTLESDLLNMVKNSQISASWAQVAASNPDRMKQMLSQAGLAGGRESIAVARKAG